jgi:hypothetical protein
MQRRRLESPGSHRSTTSAPCRENRQCHGPTDQARRDHQDQQEQGSVVSQKVMPRARKRLRAGQLGLARASQPGGTVANLLGRQGKHEVRALSTACGRDCGRCGR